MLKRCAGNSVRRGGKYSKVCTNVHNQGFSDGLDLHVLEDLDGCEAGIIIATGAAFHPSANFDSHYKSANRAFHS